VTWDLIQDHVWHCNLGMQLSYLASLKGAMSNTLSSGLNNVQDHTQWSYAAGILHIYQSALHLNCIA
jgi:hypothetical protein